MSHTQRYFLEDFLRIKPAAVNIILPQEVLLTLEALVNCVGAPDYTKTPFFASKSDRYIKKNYKNQENGEDDWISIRNFVTSKFIKKDGDALILDSLRKNMNKLSENNFSVIYKYVIDEYDKIIDNNLKLEAIELIISIMQSNYVLSKTNSKFFELLKNHDSMFEDILKIELNKFESNILELDLCSPDIDYELFCENNKKNERIKSSVLFYMDLFNLSIINIDWVHKHVILILNNIFDLAKKDDKKMLIDFYSELSFIFVTEAWNKLSKTKSSQQIMDLVIAISNIKPKSLPSITNKTIFKHMDILDIISPK